LLDGAADEFIWMEYGKIVERTREFHREQRPQSTRKLTT
jgi:hypothetical protein